MPQYRLSPLAEQDLEAILAWSHDRFGEQGRLRYEALLVRAILDVVGDPSSAGMSSAVARSSDGLNLRWPSHGVIDG
ncbi:MAG: type II toxin-antitoxin system RelE/ParE family toxin [Isosphaeraceae bacterium]